ncbi:MAG: hypothetical protein JEY97_16390 [Bacteroidales bacterium]|nr:hypothetical protein [Bacteroidales bacterium]
MIIKKLLTFPIFAMLLLVLFIKTPKSSLISTNHFVGEINNFNNISLLDTTSIVKINVLALYLSNDTLSIYDLNDKIFVSLSKNLTINNNSYDLMETSTKVLNSLLEIRDFNPEYDMMHFDCKGVKNEKYLIIVNDSIKQIDASSPFVVFQTIQEHILSSYISLLKNSPLRISNSDTSSIIDNYLDYWYIPIKIKDDWLKVKCFKDCEGCPESGVFEGWVRWRNDGELLIELFYSC